MKLPDFDPENVRVCNRSPVKVAVSVQGEGMLRAGSVITLPALSGVYRIDGSGPVSRSVLSCVNRSRASYSYVVVHDALRHGALESGPSSLKTSFVR